MLASHLLVSGRTLQKGNLVYHAPAHPALEIWARWDAEWYLLIAAEGYGADERYLGLPVAYRPGDATGFFPLYPLVIRALGGLGLGPVAAGVLASNLALLLALWLLRDLVRRDHGEPAAERALWVLLAYPTGFFLSAVYAESMMLACGLAALALARRERPLAAGMAAALAALARPTGALFLIPLLDDLVVRAAAAPGGRRWLRIAGRAAAVVGPGAAGLAAYALHCRALTGSLVPFLLRQERWRGATSGPWRAFVRYFESPQVHGAHNSTIDLGFALLLVASIPIMFMTLRRSYALYGAAAVLLPLGSSLWSFSRFSAAIFPFHVVVAVLTARSARGFAVYLALALPLAGLFMSMYAGWWWVG